MDTFWRTVVSRQFGAAMDMLENAVRACPDELWSEPSKTPEWNNRNVAGFWYVVYHTLFFLDYYLAVPGEVFAPPAPFTLDELDPAGVLPERPFTKGELQAYLGYCREKFRVAMEALTDEKARERRNFGSLDGSFAEMLLYVMRHIQHHAGQLNLLLRQGSGAAPPFVRRAEGLESGN